MNNTEDDTFNELQKPNLMQLLDIINSHTPYTTTKELVEAYHWTWKEFNDACDARIKARQ